LWTLPLVAFAFLALTFEKIGRVRWALPFHLIALVVMIAALDWYERHFGSGRQVCIIDPANGASLRLAEKLGFRAYREGLNRGHTVLLHERNASPNAQ